MYAVPVDVVLGLSAFETHQTMSKANQLVQVTQGMDVIFVSHQWLGHQHPDPGGNQLRCLQRVLRRLANGEVDVENDFKQQIVFNDRGLKSKKWWKRKMNNAYIWLDYMCMPQLSCVQVDAPHRYAFNSDETHSAACRAVAHNARNHSSSTETQDHSKGHTDAAKLLKQAVESLPAYVELSSMMLVLVPTDEHRDREGEVVGWCSWRRRGWCRLEFIAAKLSRNNMQIMVVKGPECVPEFIFSTDALQVSTYLPSLVLLQLLVYLGGGGVEFSVFRFL
jgi:hypothetical protein